jgi:hypothetical protein
MTSPGPTGSFHHRDVRVTSCREDERGGVVIPGADFAAGPACATSGRRNHRSPCAHEGRRRAQARLPVQPGASMHRAISHAVHRALRHGDGMRSHAGKRGAREERVADARKHADGARRTTASRTTRLEGMCVPAAAPSLEPSTTKARSTSEPAEQDARTRTGGGRDKRTTGRADALSTQFSAQPIIDIMSC